MEFIFPQALHNQKNLAIFQPVQPFFDSNRYKPAIKDRD